MSHIRRTFTCSALILVLRKLSICVVVNEVRGLAARCILNFFENPTLGLIIYSGGLLCFCLATKVSLDLFYVCNVVKCYLDVEIA